MCYYKAVVFDLDGTLQKSEIDYDKMTERVREILLIEGVPNDDLGNRRDIYLIIRGGENSLIRLGLNKFRVHPVLKLMTEAINVTELEAVNSVELNPNALQTLNMLSENGIQLGITTRSHRLYAEKCLFRHDIRQYFSGVLARDDVSHPKPDPRHLLATISLLNVNPQDVLYVGDTTTDLETARSANIRFIGYKRDEVWGKRLLDAGCEILIDDLLEVAKIALKPK
jgi:HAD superfamily hydrolase (TIGR01549 family)